MELMGRDELENFANDLVEDVDCDDSQIKDTYHLENRDIDETESIVTKDVDNSMISNGIEGNFSNTNPI